MYSFLSVGVCVCVFWKVSFVYSFLFLFLFFLERLYSPSQPSAVAVVEKATDN